MATYRAITRGDWLKTLAYILLAFAVIAAGGIFLISQHWPFGLILWLLVFVGGVLSFLVRWHARTTAYRCAHCGHEFEISALTDFRSPHFPSRKYLRCPSCGTRCWAEILIKQ